MDALLMNLNFIETVIMAIILTLALFGFINIFVYAYFIKLDNERDPWIRPVEVVKKNGTDQT